MNQKALIVAGALTDSVVGGGVAMAVLSSDPLAEPELTAALSEVQTLSKDRAAAGYFLRCGVAFERLAAFTPDTRTKVNLGLAALSGNDFRRASVTLIELGAMLSPTVNDFNEQTRVERDRFRQRFSGRSTSLVRFADRCLVRSYGYGPGYIRTKAMQSRLNSSLPAAAQASPAGASR